MGIFWCRDCHRYTLFTTTEADPNKRDADLAECEVCGFHFGKRIDQLQGDPRTGKPGLVLPTLSEEARREGIARLVQFGDRQRASAGIPKSVSAGVVSELVRRRGW